MWFAVFLIPALVVFALHLLLLATWERVVTWRVRRHVDRALTRGDALSLGQAAAETSEAARNWPGCKLRTLGKAVQIMQHRVEHAA